MPLQKSKSTVQHLKQQQQQQQQKQMHRQQIQQQENQQRHQNKLAMASFSTVRATQDMQAGINQFTPRFLTTPGILY